MAGINGLKVMNSEDMSDMVKRYATINPKTQGKGGGGGINLKSRSDFRMLRLVFKCTERSVRGVSTVQWFV